MVDKNMDKTFYKKKMADQTISDKSASKDKQDNTYRAFLNMSLMVKKLRQLVATHIWKNQGINWSEKSVEYHFARTILPASSTANPLAGDAETLFGDLITGYVSNKGAKLCLVEFKRSNQQINDEFEKFLRTRRGIGKRPQSNFQTWFAQENETLTKYIGHRSHFLVFADHKSKFLSTLQFASYSECNCQKFNKFSDLHLCGGHDFAVYLAELAKARCEPPNDPSGSGFQDWETLIIGKLAEQILCFDGGDVTAAGDLIKVYTRWLDIADEETRLNEMRNAVSKSCGAQYFSAHSNDIENALKQALNVMTILQFIRPENPKELSAAAEKQAGATNWPKKR